jgi:molybdopterin converting factor small subunit
MTILVKLFGELAKKISKEKSPKSPTNAEISTEGIKRVYEILEKFSIKESETSHIFVNGVYSGFNKKVNDGDRVGIFAGNQALLYKWYFTRVED